MPENPHQYFLGQRNAACVRLLERNEDVNNLIRAMLEHLVDYANKEGMDFERIRIDRPFITNDGRLVAQLTR